MAGLSMEFSLQTRSASLAWPKKPPRSMPTSAAGTSPTTESALKRPPTVGSPRKHARQPSSWARFSRSLPGSVMATRCEGIFSVFRYISKWSSTASSTLRISMVPPDLLETSTSVRSKSRPARIERTRTGDTESSTLKSSALRSTLLYLVMVIGAWVEPPWPISKTVLKPSAMMPSAKA